jgi:hypothetical protein
MADISGSWLGTYWQDGEPTRFEATFVQSGAILSGSVLDDSPLGEAQVAGEVVGLSVQFIKRYLTSSPLPIQYMGTIATDEHSMQGTWHLDKRHSGTWEAHRSNDDLMATLKNLLSAKVPTVVGR